MAEHIATSKNEVLQKIRANVNTRATRALSYEIRWVGKKPIESYRIEFTELSFFHEDVGDDIYVTVLDSDVYFKVVSRENNEYEIRFNGSIEFELTKEQINILKNRNFVIDYWLDFFDENGELANELCLTSKEAADYEFLSNYLIKLRYIEYIDSNSPALRRVAPSTVYEYRKTHATECEDSFPVIVVANNLS